MRRAGSRRERGATLVEIAIIAPVVVFIVLGLTELANAYQAESKATTSSRAGARVAAANYGDTTDAAERATVVAAIANAVTTSVEGLPTGSTPSRMVFYSADANGLPESGSLASCTTRCIEWSWNSTTSAFDTPSGSWSDPDNCGINVDYVGVNVEIDHSFFTGFIDASISIDETTIMRLEPAVFDICPPE